MSRVAVPCHAMIRVRAPGWAFSAGPLYNEALQDSVIIVREHAALTWLDLRCGTIITVTVRPARQWRRPRKNGGGDISTRHFRIAGRFDQWISSSEFES